jgi:hypothetical protein
MSRSYRKKPIRQYAPESGRIGKKFANRAVRRYKGEISNGCEYKKHYEQWDIHDCWTRCTFEEYKAVEQRWRTWCWVRGKTCETCTADWCTWNKHGRDLYVRWARFYRWK